MEVAICGCRGSLPTPGKNKLRYGGNTTCLEVRIVESCRILLTQRKSTLDCFAVAEGMGLTL